jgi:hypothetical protein
MAFSAPVPSKSTFWYATSSSFSIMWAAALPVMDESSFLAVEPPTTKSETNVKKSPRIISAVVFPEL